MRSARCARCGATAAVREMAEVDERLLCAPCANAEAERAQSMSQEFSGRRAVDPTICAACGDDHGDAELHRHGRFPMCEKCLGALRRKMAPLWLKLSILGMVLLVVLSIGANWHYYMSIYEVRMGHAALARQDVDNAAQRYRSAARWSPAERELLAMASFWEGVVELKNDHSEAAIKKLDEAIGYGFPSNKVIEDMRLNARLGAAFDRHDYDGFLKGATEAAEEHPDRSFSVGSLASAQACKYVQTGNPEFKQQSLQTLSQAKKLVKPDEAGSFEEFEERIEYRLDSRQIVTSKEFHARFPKGYHPEPTEPRP